MTNDKKETMEEKATTLMALSIAKHLFNNKFITNEEYLRMVKYINENNESDKSDNRPE